MDDKLLIAIVTAGATVVTLLLGAVGWFIKTWVDHLKSKRDMLQNVPSRTLALFQMPHGDTRWCYAVGTVQYSISLHFHFLVTNITKLPIRLTEATIICEGKKITTRPAIKLDKVIHDPENPLEVFGLHSIPAGETYEGRFNVSIIPPANYDKDIRLKVVIRDQYAVPRRLNISLPMRRSAMGSYSKLSMTAPPCVRQTGDCRLIKQGRLFTRWRLHGSVIIEASPLNIAICQVRFSNPLILPCVPKIRKDGVKTVGYWTVKENSTCEVAFDAKVMRRIDNLTTDVILIDHYGREFVVIGVGIAKGDSPPSPTTVSPPTLPQPN